MVSRAEMVKRLKDTTGLYYEYKKLFRQFTLNLEEVINEHFDIIKLCVKEKRDCELELTYLDRTLLISFSMFIDDNKCPHGVLRLSTVNMENRGRL